MIGLNGAWLGDAKVVVEVGRFFRIDMKRFSMLFPLLSVALLAGCLSLPGARESATDPVQANDEVPDEPAEQPSLDPDVVYNVLVGEVAARQRDFPLAFAHLYQAALLSADAALAEKAARLGIYASDDLQAWEAAEFWISLQPENLQARQLALLYLVRMGEAESALEQMRMIVAISEEQGEDGFLHAMAALSRGKQQELSMELMQQLAASYPEDPRGRYATALLALMLKKTDLAAEEAVSLVESNPEFSRGYPLLARILIAQGDKEGARSRLEAGLRRHPADKQILSSYARLLVEIGDYPEAYRQFTVLHRLEPEDPAHLFSLGVIAVQVERYDEARAHFEKLMALDKRTSDAAYYLGRLDQEAGRLDQAEGWFGQVVDGDFRLDARIRLIDLMFERGEFEEARSLLRDWRVSEPDLSVRLYLVEAEMLTPVWSADRMLALYAEALEVHPGDHDVLYARALYAASIDRVDILEGDLRRVLAEDPDNADALNALGYTLADKTARLEEARAYIQRALALKPDAPAILDSMGWVLYRLGDHRGALGYLRQAFAKMPDGEIAAHLGEVLWVTGEREEAQRIWREALERDPESKPLRETVERLAE